MISLRTRPRPAGWTSRFRVAGTPARVGALLLLVGMGACVPATPRSATIAPVPRGASEWMAEPGDLIRLKNWGAPEQSGDLVVDEHGVVLIPTVGRISVLGLSADSVEQRVVRAFSGRVDPSRVDVQLFRPIAVTGGVKIPSVQLADAPTSVLSLVAKAGGAIRPGADSRVFVVRSGEPTREVSMADRIGDLGVRASDQVYVQDPPFAIRNEQTIRAAYELVQFGATLLTIFFLIRQN